MIIIFICSDFLNCLRSVYTIVLTIKKRKAKPVSKQSPLRKFSLKAAIFCCFDVRPLKPPQKFQVQAKISTIPPVFPDYLSISYDYGLIYGCFLFLIFNKAAVLQNFLGLFDFIRYKKNRSSHP